MNLKDWLPKSSRYKPGELATVVLIQHLLIDHRLTTEQIKDLFGQVMHAEDEVLQRFISVK